MTERTENVAADDMYTLREWSMKATAEDDAALRAIVAAFEKEAARDFEAELRALGKALEAELAARWPIFSAGYEVHGEELRPVQSDCEGLKVRWAAGERFGLICGSAYIERHVEKLSDDWFRWRLCSLIERVIEERKPQGKAIAAYELGRLQEIWKARLAFHQGFEAGQKSIAGGKRGVAERKAARDDEETALLNRMAVLIEANPNVSRAASIAAREKLGGSAKANRRVLYPRRRK